MLTGLNISTIIYICRLTDNNVPGQDGSMYADMMRKQQQKVNTLYTLLHIYIFTYHTNISYIYLHIHII